MNNNKILNQPSVLMVAPAKYAGGGVAMIAHIIRKNVKNYQITHFHVGGVPEEKAPSKIMRHFTLLPRLAVRMARKNFDLIHINPSFNFRSLARDILIVLMCRIMGHKNILLYFHGFDERAFSRIKKNILLKKLLAIVMNSAGRILVLSPEFRNALADIGISRNKIYLTRAMFDGNAVTKSTPSSGQNILFMSRFDRRKGLYELIDAFQMLTAEFPEAKLVIAGDGKERKKLEAFAISERIIFTGYISGDKKIKHLQECDIFALPTYYPEGMPVALLEAMAAGKPVLTSRAGGIKHIIREPDNGIVLDTVSTEKVTAGLRRLLGDASYRKSAGERNAAYAWEVFEGAAGTREIEKIYDEIIRRG